MGVAALVLGIISVVIAAIFPYVGWIGIILGVIGIVLGALAKKQGQKGVATAGLVLAIIGTSLAVVLYLACVACVAGAESMAEDIASEMINGLK